MFSFSFLFLFFFCCFGSLTKVFSPVVNLSVHYMLLPIVLSTIIVYRFFFSFLKFFF